MSDRVIWKFPLSANTTQGVSMPKDAEILSVQVNRGVICLWALCDPDAEVEDRAFAVFGTGHRYSDVIFDKFADRYIGTVQMGSGVLVWHVLEATP